MSNVKTVMINDKPIALINNTPTFKSDKDKEKNYKRTEQALYNVFKKYN